MPPFRPYGKSITELIEEKQDAEYEESLKKLSNKKLRKRAMNMYFMIKNLRKGGIPKIEHELHLRFQEMGQEVLDLREALDRRRQLYKSLEELVNRGQPKSIEDMAIALRNHENEIVEELNLPSRFKDLEWNELPEEIRDEFVSCLMKIIS